MSEMEKLVNYLEQNGYEYHYNPPGTMGEAVQVCKNGEYQWDAILNPYSYGHQEGLLEIMGDIVDPEWYDLVEGYLTAEDIIQRLEKK